MKPVWTSKDQNQALRQGWGVFEFDFLGRKATGIQRFDDAYQHGWKRAPNEYAKARFRDDHAAAAYVVGRAEMGCKLARKALRVVDTAGMTVAKQANWNRLIA